MNKFTRELYRLKEQKYLFGALLFGIACFYVAHFQLADHQTIQHVVRDLGIAGVVGAYLAMTIDRVNRIRLHQEVDEYVRNVGDNFIKAVYGNALPVGLFNVIRRTLFDCKFLRTEYTAEMSIHDFTEAYLQSAPPQERSMLESFKKSLQESNVSVSGRVVLKCTSRYKIKNVSQTDANYPVVWEITNPFAGQFKGLCGVKSVVVDGKEQITGDGYYGQQTKEGETSSPLLRYERLVHLAVDQQIAVEMESYSLRLEDDSEPWQTLIPCQGMNVCVEDANGNKTIHILLDAPVVEQTATSATKNDRTNKASLSITQYVLPYQGVLVKWMPKRQSPNQASQSATSEPASSAASSAREG